ncbi:hypothetical protein Tco_1573557, partial [Tanacetum coccineum]
MGARQANQFSRLAKVEFLKFYGEDVLGWIFKCDQFFLIDSTPKEEKVMDIQEKDKNRSQNDKTKHENGKSVKQ